MHSLTLLLTELWTFNHFATYNQTVAAVWLFSSLLSKDHSQHCSVSTALFFVCTRIHRIHNAVVLLCGPLVLLHFEDASVELSCVQFVAVAPTGTVFDLLKLVKLFLQHLSAALNNDHYGHRKPLHVEVSFILLYFILS